MSARRLIAVRPDRNNLNLGAYVLFENGVTLGTYRNTLRRQTVYAGYTWQGETFGLMVAAGSGYQLRRVAAACQDPNNTNCGWTEGFSNGVLSPMVAPSIRTPEFLGASARVSFMPGIGRASSVLHLSVEAKF